MEYVNNVSVKYNKLVNQKNKYMANVKKKASLKLEAKKPAKKEQINHPSHYGGADNQYEAIKVIRAWGMDKNFCLGNTLKYISRAGKKDPKTYLEDLKKAAWYLQDEINELEKK